MSVGCEVPVLWTFGVHPVLQTALLVWKWCSACSMDGAALSVAPAARAAHTTIHATIHPSIHSSRAAIYRHPSITCCLYGHPPRAVFLAFFHSTQEVTCAISWAPSWARQQASLPTRRMCYGSWRAFWTQGAHCTMWHTVTRCPPRTGTPQGVGLTSHPLQMHSNRSSNRSNQMSRPRSPPPRGCVQA